jgi:hypothetical protein
LLAYSRAGGAPAPKNPPLAQRKDYDHEEKGKESWEEKGQLEGDITGISQGTHEAQHVVGLRKQETNGRRSGGVPLSLPLGASPIFL